MDISNEIKEYINDEESNGALLLTGKWGCGKSYLIKKLAKEINNEKEFAIIVISLFGVDSPSMLHTIIKDYYLEQTSVLLGKKAQKAYNALSKLINETAKVATLAMPNSVATSAVSTAVSSTLSVNPLNFISVKNSVGVGKNERKFVIVLDDFERCEISIQTLMGVINEYSENRKIKTILIADEEKITGGKYTEFKEKLIVRTLKLKPNHAETIHLILDNYSNKDSDYKSFLLANEACLRGAFLHSGYNNLRTFKSCLFDFKRIYNEWKNSDIPMGDIGNVLYKFCAIEYETKAGNYIRSSVLRYILKASGATDEEKNKEREKIAKKYLPNTFDNVFTSLSQWVVDGDWDKDEFIGDIKRRYAKEELSHEERFINYDLWSLEQDDIDKGMPPLVKRAYNGEATRDELIILFRKTRIMKSREMSLPCEVDYELINKGLNIRKSKIRNAEIEEPKQRTILDYTDIEPEAKHICEEIEVMSDQILAWSNRRTFIEYLRGEGNVTYYDLKDKYIDSFDDDLLNLFLNTYCTALNEEKRELCWSLIGIELNNDFYSTQDDKVTSKRNLNKLILKINELSSSTNDQISKAISNDFINKLTKKVSDFGDSNE